MSSENLKEDYVNQEYVSIPDWHRQILEERMARYHEEGMKGRPWEEVEKELLEQLPKSVTTKLRG